MDNLVQIIGSLGFPIVACIALFLRMVKMEEQNHKDYMMMDEALDSLKEAIFNLTFRLKAENKLEEKQ